MGSNIIIVFLYMLPLFSIGRNVFCNKLSRSDSSSYFIKMRDAAKSFIYSYALLSLINLVLMLICGIARWRRSALCAPPSPSATSCVSTTT